MMNQDQYGVLHDIMDHLNGLPFSIRYSEFTEDSTNRTLLYGYTTDRATWHVYLMDGLVHQVEYGYGFDPMSSVTLFNDYDDLIPNKRLYPAACDFHFCRFLSMKNVYLPFTTFEERPPMQFYGLIFEE